MSQEYDLHVVGKDTGDCIMLVRVHHHLWAELAQNSQHVSFNQITEGRTIIVPDLDVARYTIVVNFLEPESHPNLKSLMDDLLD